MAGLLVREVEQLRQGVNAGRETVPFSADLPVGLATKILDLIDKESAGGAIVVGTHDELTPAQAAALLGVSRPFVSRLIAAGQMDARQVGAHWRITMTAVHKYQERMRAKKIAAKDAYATALDAAGLYE
jgi:excisionase family DNA binding protein